MSVNVAELVSIIRTTITMAGLATGLLVAGCSVSQDTAAFRVVELVDSLTAADAYLDDEKKTNGSGYESVGTYASVPVGEQSISLRASDGTSNLLTSDIELAVDARYSAVLAGTAAAPMLYLVDETPTEPGSGLFRLRILNTVASGPAYDVFITAESVDIDTVSPTIAATATGQTSGSFDLNAGTYRVRITTGALRDLVYDSGPTATVVFGSNTTGSLVIYNGASAALVKAVLLTGSDANSTAATRSSLARIRLVNAADSNDTLNLRESGSLLFAGLGPSAASSYLEVAVDAAGANTYALESNGSPGINFGDFPLTLTAGEDHTILAAGTSPNLSLNLIGDDNALPQTGLANLRAINGVSGGGSADVFVNFRRDFSAIQQDEASPSYLAYVPASSYKFGAELSNGAQLFDLGDFELEEDRVYSLLMYGSVTAPMAILLTDR